MSIINNVDPYEVPKTEWCQDIEQYPTISFLDVVSYLVLQCSAYTMDEFRAYKSLEAYNQFVFGWVKEIKVMNIEGKP